MVFLSYYLLKQMEFNLHVNVQVCITIGVTFSQCSSFTSSQAQQPIAQFSSNHSSCFRPNVSLLCSQPC